MREKVEIDCEILELWSIRGVGGGGWEREKENDREMR